MGVPKRVEGERMRAEDSLQCDHHREEESGTAAPSHILTKGERMCLHLSSLPGSKVLRSRALFLLLGVARKLLLWERRSCTRSEIDATTVSEVETWSTELSPVILNTRTSV